MYSHLPWFTWPLAILLELINHLLFVGIHLLGSIAGLALIASGLILTGTIVGAIFGIPIICAGIYIRYRCQFT